MRIGILSASIYMDEQKYEKRISAPRKLVKDLVAGLVAAHHDVSFFTVPNVKSPARVISSDTELLTNSFSLDYQQDLLPDVNAIVSLYEVKKYYELGLVRKAYQIAKSDHLDVVHVFHSYANLAHYFSDFFPCPLVYTMHAPPAPIGTLDHWRYQKFAMQNFVAISSSQKKEFRQAFPGMSVRDVVYNGIDIAEYPMQQNAEDYYCFIGRLVPEKGLDVAIALARELNIKLRIATDLNPVIAASKYYQEKIQPQLQSNNIFLEGILNSHQKCTLIGNAKAFIFPLQWEEPFGMVLIESMALGTPVIAYARGSVPEVVVDGETGFLVNPSDHDIRGKWIVKKTGSEGLKEATHLLSTMAPDAYTKMRQESRSRVEAMFTIANMVKGYEQVYKSLLS